jgi:hypothetical protein
VKVRILNFEEALRMYPVKAFYDYDNETIHIPDKDAMWNIVFLHEYIHHLRRDKFTLKFEANFIFVFFFILSLAVLSVFLFQPLIFVAPVLLFLFAFCYVYEEYYVQKKLIKELNVNVEEILHKETVEEDAGLP